MRVLAPLSALPPTSQQRHVVRPEAESPNTGAALALCWFLKGNAEALQLPERTVLELGCGLGLAGIFAARRLLAPPPPPFAAAPSVTALTLRAAAPAPLLLPRYFAVRALRRGAHSVHRRPRGRDGDVPPLCRDERRRR